MNQTRPLCLWCNRHGCHLSWISGPIILSPRDPSNRSHVIEKNKNKPRPSAKGCTAKQELNLDTNWS